MNLDEAARTTLSLAAAQAAETAGSVHDILLSYAWEVKA